MRRNFYFWVFSSLFGVSLLFGYITLQKGPHSIPNSLSDFIIGSWELQQKQPNINYNITQLEFDPSGILICNAHFPDGAYYNIVFHYKVITNNTIEITGRLRDTWELQQQGDKLIISSKFWPGNISTYTRMATPNWAIISLSLGFLVISLFFFEMPEKNIDKRKLNVLYKVLQIGSTLIMIGVGVISGILIANLPFLLQIKLPWDAVITLEFSFGLFVFGIKTIRANYLSKGFLYYLGVFMFSSSLFGLVGGILRLIVFVAYKSYLT